jgi:hypothetical protein
MKATPLNKDDGWPIALNLVGEPTTIVLKGKKKGVVHEKRKVWRLISPETL